MAAIADRHRRAVRRRARDRQLPPLAGRPQRRDRRRDRLQRRVDPAALRHQAAPLRHARGDRADDVGRRVARQALEHAGVDAEQIDCVIVATVTHLLQTPAIATAIAHELGTDQAAAFDISAACAGFCHGLALADQMVRGGGAGHVLVIGVERLSDITDSTDRGTAFIFADGAGAAVVGPSDTPGIGPVVWGSDGEQFDLIRQNEDWRDVIAAEDRRRMPSLTMQGNPVFRWASFTMAKVAHQALDRAGITPDDLDVFVPHQANMRIIDAMARAMKLPERVKIARDIAEQGNTSAASIPLALDRMIDEGQATQRRHRAAHRVRCRPGVRRPGHHRSLDRP